MIDDVETIMNFVQLVNILYSEKTALINRLNFSWNLVCQRFKQRCCIDNSKYVSATN